MNVYKIKVTSSGNKKWETSKFEKKFSYSLKMFIKSNTKKGLELNEKYIKGKTYIVDRYKVHKLVDYLLKESTDDTKRVQGSYYVLNKKITPPTKYKACSTISSYVVLKTNKDLSKKLEDINKEYLNITKRKANSSDDPVKFIKPLKNKYKPTDKMIFKKSSPLVIKSTVKQILEPKESFYKEIYSQLNLNKECFEIIYSDATSEQRMNKNIYFLPDCLEEYKKDNTPVVFVSEEIYIKMLLKTLNLEVNNNKEYKIIDNKGISILKVNKEIKGKNKIFNAIGAAITIKTNDEKFKEQGNLYGVGHMTNYGFGFVFTKDETFGGSKANTNADNNRNNKNKPKTSHSKSPSNTSGTSKEQGPSEGVPEAFRNLGNAK